VLVVLALTMTFIGLASGHGPGAWGAVCAVGGAAYLAGVVLFARRT